VRTSCLQPAAVAGRALAVISILLVSCPGGSNEKPDAGAAGSAKPPATEAPSLGCNEPCEDGECAAGLVCATNVHVGNGAKVCAPAECDDCYTGLLCNFSEACEFESCGTAQVGACFMGEEADRTCWQAHAAILGSQYADAHRVCDNEGGHDFMADACCADLGFAELCPEYDYDIGTVRYYDGSNECDWGCDEPCMHVESCDAAPALACGASCGSSYGVCGEGLTCYQPQGKGPCEAEWCTGYCGPPTCEDDANSCGVQCADALGCALRVCSPEGRCPPGEVCHPDGCCLTRAFCDGTRCETSADCSVEGEVCDVNGCCVSESSSAGTGGAGGDGGTGAGGAGGTTGGSVELEVWGTAWGRTGDQGAMGQIVVHALDHTTNTHRICQVVESVAEVALTCRETNSGLGSFTDTELSHDLDRSPLLCSITDNYVLDHWYVSPMTYSKESGLLVITSPDGDEMTLEAVGAAMLDQHPRRTDTSWSFRSTWGELLDFCTIPRPSE
jgi:hypothetical protein